LKVKNYKLSGVHRVLEIHGKGGKELIEVFRASAEVADH